MNGTQSQFKLGLFVLGGVTLVLAGLFLFGLRRRLEEKSKFETYVTRGVGGLAIGAPVKLLGVTVGEVTDLEFSWNEYPGGQPTCVVVHFGVRVTALPSAPAFDLQQAVQTGLRAVVETEGITGVAVLSLTYVNPAENPPLLVSWAPRHPVIPSAPSRLDQIIGSVRDTLASLQRVDFDHLAARIDHLAATADGTLSKLDTRRLSSELIAASGQVDALAKEARGTLRGMQLEALAHNTNGLVSSLRDTNARAQRLIDHLSDVDANELRQALASFQQAIHGLDQTTTQLRRYPSGFLFGEAPPPAQSVERSH
jgi:paraquat-inducible protein B